MNLEFMQHLLCRRPNHVLFFEQLEGRSGPASLSFPQMPIYTPLPPHALAHLLFGSSSFRKDVFEDTVFLF